MAGHVFEVKHDAKAEKFYIELEPHREAFLVYTHANKVMDIYLVFVPPDFREKGLDEALAECAFEYARKKGLKVIPRCPFIKNSFLKKHPEYTKLVTEKYA